MADLIDLAQQLKDGTITGNDLAKMVTENEITKGDRRKITKLSLTVGTAKELSERQKLRLAVKEKKALPKMSQEERKRKFVSDLETDREKDAANFTTCLGCRKRGHFLKDCPKAIYATDCNTTEICFNCGAKDHTLKNCTQDRKSGGRLQYATCFICKKVGHISKDCQENPNGLYVNGGCCHICLQKTHLVKDCPERTEEDKLAFLARKQAKDDEEQYGVRVKGVTVSDDNVKGDFIEMGDDEAENDYSDEEGGKKKKSKKEKKEKKSKK
jgi:hypothetical protein